MPSGKIDTSWQHPFVSIFNGPDGWSKGRQQGDVQQVMDKSIGKRCLRIAGAVSATNFIVCPENPKAGPLHLVGRYVYFQLRPLGDKVMTLHLDLAMTDGQPLRVALSTLFSQCKSHGSNLRVPLPIDRDPKRPWAVVAVDLATLVGDHLGVSGPGFGHIKSLRLCSNMVARGVYTSDNIYTPESLPRDMALPVPGGRPWTSLYQWVWIPREPRLDTPPGSSPTDVLTGTDAPLRGADLDAGDHRAGPLTVKNISNLQANRPPPKRSEKRHYVSTSALLGGRVLDENQQEDGLRRAAEVLQQYGKTQGHPVALAPQDGPPEAAPKARQPQPVLRKTPRQAPVSPYQVDWDGTGGEAELNMSQEEHLEPEKAALECPVVFRGRHLAPDLLAKPEAVLFEPDPSLELERVVGYSGGRPSTLTWARRDRLLAFPSNNAIALMDVKAATAGSKAQPGAAPQEPPAHLFLHGHTDVVTHMETSAGGQLLASAQGGGPGGALALVRIWDLAALKCVAHFEAHPSSIACIAWSADDRLLCTVGGDHQRRTQVIVWDVGLLMAARKGNAEVTRSTAILARQISDFPITRIRFSPYERQRLVSCGRENVRFWRINRRHLPACPAVLNEFARNSEFTDLAFESPCGMAGVLPDEADHGPARVVYVSTRAGTLMQVDYHSRQLVCVLRLHNGPINSVSINEGFAVTGSDDRFLRVWPLDFSDFLLEAQHESEVTSVALSADGLKLAVGTAKGSVGVLDVVTHGYATCMRSHQGRIVAMAHDPSISCQEFATIGEDSTIRVWDLLGGAQRYEFLSPHDRPIALEYHPSEKHIACGFESGSVRVFDVATTGTLFEYQQHRGKVLQVAYSPDAQRLFSAGADGLICVYDTARGYQPIKMVASDLPGEGVLLAVSPASDLLAMVESDPGSILLYDTQTMAIARRFGRERKHAWANGGEARRDSSSWMTVAGDAASKLNGALPGATAAAAPFISLAFTPDGRDLVACTRTKVMRFQLDQQQAYELPLGASGVPQSSIQSGATDQSVAWSALLPCKANRVTTLLPATGPWLLMASPEQAEGGALEGKPGQKPPTGSPLYLCQVQHGDAGPAMVVSMPQIFTGHFGDLTAAKSTPNGQWLVSGDSTGAILIWRYQGDPPEMEPSSPVTPVVRGLEPPDVAIELAQKSGALPPAAAATAAAALANGRGPPSYFTGPGSHSPNGQEVSQEAFHDPPSYADSPRRGVTIPAARNAPLDSSQVQPAESDGPPHHAHSQPSQVQQEDLKASVLAPPSSRSAQPPPVRHAWGPAPDNPPPQSRGGAPTPFGNMEEIVAQWAGRAAGGQMGNTSGLWPQGEDPPRQPQTLLESDAMSLSHVAGFTGGEQGLLWQAHTGRLVYAVDRMVVVEDIDGGAQQVLRHRGPPTSLLAAASGGFLISAAEEPNDPACPPVAGGAQGVLTIWEGLQGGGAGAAPRPTCMPQLDAYGVQALALSRDGRFLAAAGVWSDLEGCCVLVVYTGTAESTVPTVPLVHTNLEDPVQRVVILSCDPAHRTSHLTLATSSGGVVTVYEITRGKARLHKLASLALEGWVVAMAACGPDILLAADAAGTLTAMDWTRIESRQMSSRQWGGFGPTGAHRGGTACLMGNAGGTVAVMSKGGWLVLWKVAANDEDITYRMVAAVDVSATLAGARVCATAWSEDFSDGVLGTLEGGLWQLHLDLEEAQQGQQDGGEISYKLSRIGGGQRAGISGLSTSTDGTLVVAGSADPGGGVRVYATQGLLALLQFETPAPAACVAFSPRDEAGVEPKCVAGCVDGSVCVLDLGSGAVKSSKAFPDWRSQEPVTCISVLAGGKGCLVGTVGGDVALLSLDGKRSGRVVATAKLAGPVTSLQASPLRQNPGQCVAACGGEAASVYIFYTNTSKGVLKELHSVKALENIEEDVDPYPLAAFTHTDATLAFTANSAESSTLNLWRYSTHHVGESTTLSDVASALSIEGHVAAVGMQDGSVCLVDTRTLAMMGQCSAHAGPATALTWAVSAEEEWRVLSAGGMVLLQWDVAAAVADAILVTKAPPPQDHLAEGSSQLGSPKSFRSINSPKSVRSLTPTVRSLTPSHKRQGR